MPVSALSSSSVRAPGQRGRRHPGGKSGCQADMTKPPTHWTGNGRIVTFAMEIVVHLTRQWISRADIAIERSAAVTVPRPGSSGRSARCRL